MPTPNDDTHHPLSTVDSGNHATCPPDHNGARGWRTQQGQPNEDVDAISDDASRSSSLAIEDSQIPSTSLNDVDLAGVSKIQQIPQEAETEDGPSTMSPSSESGCREGEARPVSASPMLKPLLDYSHKTSTSFELSSTRVRSSTLSQYVTLGKN